MRFGSLFSGIGGFDRGFERIGMSCAWQVENDRSCQKVLAHHWPNVKRYGDIREVVDLEPVDLICGGFPCQDLSVAGGRAGLAGERSGLWHEFHRILTECRPRWAVVENVPGLLSSNGGRDFAVILRGLVECGYGVAYRILDAQYFGVAQRRRRVFIVGSLGDGRVAQALFESEGLPGHTPPRRQEGTANTGLSGTLSANGGGIDRPAGNANELDFCVAAPLRAGRARADTFGDAGNVVAFQQNTRDEVRLIGGNGSHVGALSAEPGMKQQNYIAGAITTHQRRGNPDNQTFVVAPSLVSHHNNLDKQAYIAFDPLRAGIERTFIHRTGSFGVRRLTPVECERLQGFPDGFTDLPQSDSMRYRQLGNAVCVPVVEWIGRRLWVAEYNE